MKIDAINITDAWHKLMRKIVFRETPIDVLANVIEIEHEGFQPLYKSEPPRSKDTTGGASDGNAIGVLMNYDNITKR